MLSTEKVHSPGTPALDIGGVSAAIGGEIMPFGVGRGGDEVARPVMGKTAFGSPDEPSQCDGRPVPELPSAAPEFTPPRRANYLHGHR